MIEIKKGTHPNMNTLKFDGNENKNLNNAKRLENKNQKRNNERTNNNNKKNRISKEANKTLANKIRYMYMSRSIVRSSSSIAICVYTSFFPPNK